MKTILQYWELLKIAVSVFLSRSVGNITNATNQEWKIFLLDGNENTIESVKEAVHSIVKNVAIKFVDKKEDANVLVESKTDAFGFMQVRGIFHIMIPIRTEDNREFVDFAITTIAKLLTVLGKRVYS